MLKLRPHHIIDIFRDFGNSNPFVPHPYGHDYHKVAINIINNIQQKVQLVLQADDICAPCKHLGSGGQCLDKLVNHPFSDSKQVYNDYLDKKIFALFNLSEEKIMTLKEFLQLIAVNIKLFDQIYPHSQDIIEQRKHLILKGIAKVNISLSK